MIRQIMLAVWCVVMSCGCVVCELEVGFYRNSCGLAESIVKDEVRRAFCKDPGIAPGLLRIHFHDCFVRGCDASVLLDSSSSNIAEKESPANNPSLRGFQVIDRAKGRLEALCQGVVSCSDILAFAARDNIEITIGVRRSRRKKGRQSVTRFQYIEKLTSAVIQSGPTHSPIWQKSVISGFTLSDMVTLSGAHTIGRSYNTSFGDKLYNFNGTSSEEPSLDPEYAAELRRQCPQGNSDTDAVVPMNPSSPAITDISYYLDVLANRGVFSSDQTLLTNTETALQVIRNAKNPWLWNTMFVNAMVKMGGLDVLAGTVGEIRTNCRLINALQNQSFHCHASLFFAIAVGLSVSGYQILLYTTIGCRLVKWKRTVYHH